MRLRMPISMINSKRSTNRPGAPALGCRPGFASCGSKLQRPNAPSSLSRTRTKWSMPAGERSMSSSSPSSTANSFLRGRRPRRRARSSIACKSVLQSNSPEAAVIATVADTLKNEVITKLRSQYLELARREADWTPRYGANHLAVVNLRNQMREIQNSIRDELQRIAETYKSDFEIAKQHEDSVQKQLDQAVSQSQVTNEAQVALRELESNAQTYRALYDNFLQRYMESVQQQSFPITEARVISAATRPL